MSDIDVNKLKALAEKATPGPWASDIDIFDGDRGYEACIVSESTDTHGMMLATIGADVAVHRGGDDMRMASWTAADSAIRDQRVEQAKNSQAAHDAAFIAAASPDVILSLLSELQRLRLASSDAAVERIAELEGALNHAASENLAFNLKVAGEINEARQQRDSALADVARMTKYVAAHDEEYQTMKDVLRAEHEACQRMRPVYEASIEFARTLLPDPGRVSPQLATLLDRASSHVRIIDAANRSSKP